MRQGGVAAQFVQQVDATAGRVDVTLTRTGDATGASGAGLVAAILFAWLADEERELPGPSPKSENQSGPHAVAPAKLFPTGALWAFFLATSFLFSLRDFAGSAMATSGSLFLQNAHGFDPKFTGLALSGIFIASAISNPIFGHLSDGARCRGSRSSSCWS